MFGFLWSDECEYVYVCLNVHLLLQVDHYLIYTFLCRKFTVNHVKQNNQQQKREWNCEKKNIFTFNIMIIFYTFERIGHAQYSITLYSWVTWHFNFSLYVVWIPRVISCIMPHSTDKGLPPRYYDRVEKSMLLKNEHPCLLVCEHLNQVHSEFK